MKYRQALIHSLRLDYEKENMLLVQARSAIDPDKLMEQMEITPVPPMNANMLTELIMSTNASTAPSVSEKKLDPLLQKVGRKIARVPHTYVWTEGRKAMIEILCGICPNFSDSGTAAAINDLVDYNIDISHFVPSIIEAGDGFYDGLRMPIELIENMAITDGTKRIIASAIKSNMSKLGPKHMDLVMRTLDDTNDRDASIRRTYLQHFTPHGDEVIRALAHIFRYHRSQFEGLD